MTQLIHPHPTEHYDTLVFGKALDEFMSARLPRDFTRMIEGELTDRLIVDLEEQLKLGQDTTEPRTLYAVNTAAIDAWQSAKCPRPAKTGYAVAGALGLTGIALGLATLEINLSSLPPDYQHVIDGAGALLGAGGFAAAAFARNKLSPDGWRKHVLQLQKDSFAEQIPYFLVDSQYERRTVVSEHLQRPNLFTEVVYESEQGRFESVIENRTYLSLVVDGMLRINEVPVQPRSLPEVLQPINPLVRGTLAFIIEGQLTPPRNS